MNDKKDRTYFVCGGGHQGLAMAAHLALNGEKVTLWNRTLSHIEKIAKTNEIVSNGTVNGRAHIECASEKIEEVISDFILVTVPSTAYPSVAREIAPFVDENTRIILNPGRTFGAISFAEELKRNHVKSLPQIAETQTIVYTCRRNGDNEVTIFALKNGVSLATLPGIDAASIIDEMPKCLGKYFKAEKDIMTTSLSNVGMVLHCAPVLMNIGWIESDAVDFKYYYDGISKSVARFLEKMDDERIQLAKALGCQIESVGDWMRRIYGVRGSDLYECIRENEAYSKIDAPPSLQSRYILEDVPNGLVPVEHLAMGLSLEVPAITNIINMSNMIYETDFRKNGRTFGMDIIRQYLVR